MPGFYPRIHHLGPDADEWLAQYFQTTLVRGVRDLTQVGKLEASAVSSGCARAGPAACTTETRTD